MNGAHSRRAGRAAGPRILLINPPVYDFSAYDFWLKPHGLLAAAGQARGQATLELFDFMDRIRHREVSVGRLREGTWNRGEYLSENLPTPPALAGIPRKYSRYGLPRTMFQEFLQDSEPFDQAWIGTGLTYWYPGVREVIEDIREWAPACRIVLGGVYATLCPDHARTLGADCVVSGEDLAPLRAFAGLDPDAGQLPYWEGYDVLKVGAIRLSHGCPFRCTYCSAPLRPGGFEPRAPDRVMAEVEALQRAGAQDIAFYDDALLVQPDRALIPFLETLIRRRVGLNFHTPNALHVRLLTRELAGLMVRAGFRTFFLGFESSDAGWQEATGGKVESDELARCVERLAGAGVGLSQITAYVMLGHWRDTPEQVERSMRFVHSLGIRIMLAEFSPIPGTPDGEACRPRVNLDEPLEHSKTLFPVRRMGWEAVQRCKALCRELNSRRMLAGME